MTRQEAYAFFKQVDGKKIRWTMWKQGEYFVPDTLRLDLTSMKFTLMGSLYNIYGSISTLHHVEYPVCNGFLPSDYLERWELVDVVLELAGITKEIPNKCTCDMRDLMLQGCKCGGK